MVLRSEIEDRKAAMESAIAAVKAEAAEKEAMHQAALADLKALLAPLDKIASLLPSAAKKILDKYRG